MKANRFLKANVIWLLFFLLLIIFFVFRELLVFDKFLLYKDTGEDTLNHYWPCYHFLGERFKDFNFSTWSHQIGLGATIFVYGIRFFDPFFALLLFVPTSFLPHSLVFWVILKFLLAGVFFYLYLSTFQLSNYSRLVGGLLYALSGYMVSRGQHAHVISLMVLAPLILYFFELWLQKKIWVPLYMLSVLIFIFGIYLMTLITSYLVLYGIFRYIELHPFKIKAFASFCVKSLGIGFLAAGTAAVILLPSLATLAQSTRLFMGQTKFSLFDLNQLSYYVTLIFKFFSSDILGVENYFGYLNYYNAPNVYAGLLTLLMIPQVFFCFKKKERTIYLVFLAVLLILLIFPFFSYASHGFERDMYRWVFIVVLFQVLLAVRVLERLLKTASINKKLLAGTVGFFTFLLAAGYLLGAKVLKWETPDLGSVSSKIIIIFLFLIIYTTLLLFLNNKSKQIVKTALVIVICCELGLSLFNNFIHNRSLVTKQDMEKNHWYYFDDTLPAVGFIKKKEGNTNFYRVNKNYISRYYNDSTIQGYPGIPVYTIMMNANLANFIRWTGLENKKKIKILKGLDARLHLETLLNIKYFLTKTKEIVPFGYEYLDSFGEVHVYRNTFALPLGILYDSYYPLKEFKKLPISLKDTVILEAAILQDKKNASQKLKKFNIKKPYISNSKAVETYKVSRIDKGNGFYESIIEVDVPEACNPPGVKYIRLDFLLHNGINSIGTLSVIDGKGKVYDNIKKIPIYTKTRNYSISAGSLQDIRSVRFKIEKSNKLEIERFRFQVSHYSQEELHRFISLIEKLRKNTMKITSLEDDYIQGNIRMEHPGLLFFSIPFDKGWKLKINGKERPLEQVNIGFMGVFLDRGDHRIELKYTLPLSGLGMIITLISLFSFIGIMFLQKK